MMLLYLLPILAGAALSAGLAAYAWRKRPAAGALPMAWLAAAAAVWSFGYALEIASAPLASKVFWAKVQYLGIVAAPVAWLSLGLAYTGRDKSLTRRTLAPLSLIPLATLAILWVQRPLIWPELHTAPAGAVSLSPSVA